jgi:transcription antitermination protein NusB
MSTISPAHNAKRLARLAAVQGLYQQTLAKTPVDKVVKHFSDNPAAFLEETGAADAASADKELFADVVRGVASNLEALDAMIAGACDEGVSSARIEVLLKAIMRAGAYELHHHGSIPAGVIINDYVDVAHVFFDAKEPGFVNAVLDKLAKKLRS